MIKGRIKLKEKINLDLTFESGQIFRWRKIGNYWLGVAYDSAIALKKSDHAIEYKIDGKVKEEELMVFLSIGEDFTEIFNKMPNDDIAVKLFFKYRGLKILRQNPWECMLCYLSTSMNNIKRINSLLEKLSSLSNKSFSIGNFKFKAYPAFEDLISLSSKDFYKLGFGFRSKYYEDMINKVKQGFDVNSLQFLNTDELRDKLMYIKGIGKKTADCIALYSFHRLECFPQDTWIKKAIQKYYRKQIENYIGIKLKAGLLNEKYYQKISDFFNQKYYAIAGFIQLLLYVHIRKI